LLQIFTIPFQTNHIPIFSYLYYLITVTNRDKFILYILYEMYVQYRQIFVVSYQYMVGMGISQHNAQGTK